MEEKETKKVVRRVKKTSNKETVEVKKTKERIEDIKKPLEFSLVEVIIIILVTTLLVSVASGVIVFRNYGKLSVKVSTNGKDIGEIYEHYNYILNNYFGEVNKEELIDAAIGGMYNYLGDEYTTYIDKDNTNSLQEQLGGTYTGVGIEITMDNNKIVINRVFSNSPAFEAGLKKGDILIKLDDTDLSDKDSLFVSKSIKDNKEKDTFEITYLRDGKEYKTTLTKKLISIDSVESNEYEKVGYIKISTFSSVTAEQVKNAMTKFSKNIKSVVIDLRDNTGGYLTAAHEVSDLFLEKGQIIYNLEEKDGKKTSFAAKNGVTRKFDKIVILVNGNSASASEILTLALKENLDATVVGTKTYGKGTVQETKVLSSGAMVKYTTSHWLSPDGNSINKIGISPDIEVSDVSKQLDKALEVAK